jgi:hypothetical protein
LKNASATAAAFFIYSQKEPIDGDSTPDIIRNFIFFSFNALTI